MTFRQPLLTLFVLLALTLPSLAQPAKKDSSPATANGQHALLVGVSNYPNLDKKFQLAGPVNDVVLMKDTLKKYFKFTDAQIVTLSEADGLKKAELLPTRANIEREFKRLANVAKDGDYVFIMMGGHGSQQPESGRGEPEPDGLDEIFLPRDVGKWNDTARTAANAIVDKDIGEWLEAIKKKGASICIIFDACHSGTMLRADEEIKRQLKPTYDLGIPEKAIEESVATAKKRVAANPNRERGQSGPVDTNFKFAEKGGLVAISASLPNEPTVESLMPPRSKDAKPYGLLTYTICQVLTQAVENGSEPLTYRELAQRVQQHYEILGRKFPTPVIEGGDRDREFLGNKIFEGRSDMMLMKSPDGLKVNAGALHGLTRDSILSVKPPAGLGEKRLGFVKITEVRATESDIEPIEYENVKAVANLPTGGVCRLVFVDYGDLKLRVAIDSTNDAGGMISPNTRKALVDICGKLLGPNSLIEIVQDVKLANWVIQVVGTDRVILVPALGWGTFTVGKDPAFGPVTIDDKLGKWLQSSLSSIGRAENLKAIVCRDGGIGGDAAPKFEAELMINGQVTKWPDPNIVLFDQDKVTLTLKNTGRVAIDITVLYLDSCFGIDSLYPNPKKGEFNRFLPGEKTPPLRFIANSKTIGREHLLIFAVKAGIGLPVDYSGLEQRSIVGFRESSATRASSKRNALDALLLKGAYADGDARGITRQADDSPHTLKMITWQIRPDKRPLKN